MRWKSCAAVAAVCLVAAAATAQQKLDKVQLGQDLLGKKPTPEELKGKVVLLEFWGVNCPPCIATMPHVVRWNEEMTDLGLVVIGVHSQNVEADEVRAVAGRLGMRFPVIQGASGADVTTIPHSLLFDHTGQCVFNGKPAELETKLRPTVGAALLADVTDPPKSVAAVADLLKKGGSPVDALKKLNTLKNDSDKKVAAAAQAIVTKITSIAQARLDEAKGQVKDDPIAAYDAAWVTAVRWKGLPLGTQATEIVNKVKTDKLVVAELKARPALDGLKKLDTALSATMKDDAEAKTAEFKKAHAAQLKQMTQAYQAMVKSNPDTPSAKSAEVIAKKYELKGK